jgi:two-component sensor histidine kinase
VIEIEKLLVQRETLLKSIIESSPEVIVFALDRNYMYISFNNNHKQTMNHIWGKDIDEGISMLNIISLESDRQRAKENFDRAFSGEHFTLYEEYGDEELSRQFWANYYSPLVSPEGHIIGLSCFVLNQTKQHQAEAQVRKLLSEKELLLKEVHHRIKNNMNIIYSLLKLQAGSIEESEAKQKIDDAAGRVQSMMILYERLFQSDNLLEISLKVYITSLLQEVISALPNELITIQANIQDFEVDTGILSSLGIIINELITNSIKHAFNGKEYGKIQISIKKSDDLFEFVYSDNGSGIPEDILMGEQKGFGIKLIEMLLGQIGASFFMENENGARLRFSSPIKQ